MCHEISEEESGVISDKESSSQIIKTKHNPKHDKRQPTKLTKELKKSGTTLASILEEEHLIGSMPANNIELDIRDLKRDPKSEKKLMIIQLNCNGLRNKLLEIKLLTYTTKPDILCLCETFVNPDYEPKFIGYNAYWKHRVGNRGGLGILVRRDITSQIHVLMPFDSPKLELQCIQILSNGLTIDIVNLYNPSQKITEQELKHYSGQLSGHSIIIGDFNAHSPIWDARGRSNPTGISIEQFITNSNFHLINEFNTPTYIDHRCNTASCLDLCLVSNPFMGISEFNRGRDVGSDHFPIICTIDFVCKRDAEKTTKRWKYSTANWEKFKDTLENTNVPVPFPVDAETHNEILTLQIIKAAEVAIGRSSGERGLKRHVSGWDDSCSQAVKQRRQARNRLWKNPTTENLIQWKKARAKARWIVKQKKTQSFQTFVNSIDSKTPSKTIWNKIKSLNGGKVNADLKLGDPCKSKEENAEQFLSHFTRFKSAATGSQMEVVEDQIEEMSYDGNDIPPITLHKIKNILKKL